jgi:hypothetical protein
MLATSLAGKDLPATGSATAAPHRTARSRRYWGLATRVPMIDTATTPGGDTSKLTHHLRGDTGARRMTGMAQAAQPPRSAAERAAIGHLKARLAQQFPELSPEQIDRAVAGHYDTFDDSPIRDFVPVLVERAARQQLSDQRAKQHRA